MRYIISFFIVLLLVVIFVLSFLLFKEKFDTEIPLSTDDPNSGPDDFMQALGITDPSSQLLISNSNGDLSLLPLSKLHAGINKVSQDGIVNNNTYYTTTDDLQKNYTTTDDLQKNYLQKRTPYSITNRALVDIKNPGKQTIHVSNASSDGYPLKADTSTCKDGDWYNFEFDEPC